MGAKSHAIHEPREREVLIRRVFDAPRALVFKAWTDPEHVTRWWGPQGFTVSLCEMDLHVGGAWHVRMRSPQGVEDRQRGVFREVVAPERLVFTYAFEDENGVRGHETIVTVSFTDIGGKTQVLVHHAVFESIKVAEEHVAGWGQTMDRLAEYLAKA